MNILLTGASRGIGKAAADALTAAGHRVIGTSTRGGEGLIAADFADPAAADLSRLAILHFREAGGGRIVNVASRAAYRGDSPQHSHYAASKAGLVGMSKALAQELASRNITVNCVAPGFIRSAMTDVLPDAQKSALLGRIPAGDLGTGEDIGAAVVYLASKEAGYVTGQTIHVNGGMAMV